MSTRLFAVLFTALFIIGIFPVLFIQNFGSASAGVTAGFLLPAQNVFDVAGAIFIGLLSTWLAGEAILLLPLCTLLMLITGSLTEIDEHVFYAVHEFILGAIILFALAISQLRSKGLIFYIAPISIWAYLAGGGFMKSIPSITTPFFFLIGTTLSILSLLAIGVAIGITLTERIQDSVGRLKSSSAFSSFLSLF